MRQPVTVYDTITKDIISYRTVILPSTQHVTIPSTAVITIGSTSTTYTTTVTEPTTTAFDYTTQILYTLVVDYSIATSDIILPVSTRVVGWHKGVPEVEPHYVTTDWPLRWGPVLGPEPTQYIIYSAGQTGVGGQ